MMIFDLSTLMVIILALVVLTNIITQVAKQLLPDKISANFLAAGVSIALTLIAFFAYCEICLIPVTWYMVLAAVVVGIMVAYAAMFGYDKLKQAFEQLTGGES